MKFMKTLNEVLDMLIGEVSNTNPISNFFVVV